MPPENIAQDFNFNLPFKLLTWIKYHETFWNKKNAKKLERGLLL